MLKFMEYGKSIEIYAGNGSFVGSLYLDGGIYKLSSSSTGFYNCTPEEFRQFADKIDELNG